MPRRFVFAASLTLCALSVSALAVEARASDPPAKTDPYEASLVRARVIEQQLIATVDAICWSSVTVLNKTIPTETELKGKTFTREPQTRSGGSGVIISRKGKLWILTNQHVVDGNDALAVVMRDGVERKVEVFDAVKQYDIALLRFIDKCPAAFKGVAVTGKKSTDLEEGQWCVATGNPFFLATDGQPVVTLGVISGKDRVLGGNFVYGRAIQHDAAVNPGNSGGPLWNVKGELTGINGMIQSINAVKGQGASNMGASYSIPVDQIDAFLSRLIDAKKDASAGYLGALTETETDKAGKAVGARVVAVDPRGPLAEAKGLRPNDLIESLTISGTGTRHVIRTESDLTNALSLCASGCKVTIAYRRLGKSGTWSGDLCTSPE